ncbi:MAG: hypothetical protein IH623_06600 [Verrucomicrobia bacterium]|nr:hypothetical protein [Verrucomicrobiota bacterium]
MKRTKPILLILSSLALAASVGAQTFVGANVGTPALAGSVTGTAPGTQTITGGGNDIWGTSDNFYYVYTSVTGQVWEAKVRVHDLVRAAGDDGWTKCELMVRVPDASGIPQGPDRFVAAMTTGSTGQNEVGPQYRAVRGGDAGNANFGFTGGIIRPTYPNTWLRLTRQGSVFTIWYGTDGTTWNKYADINTAGTLNGFGNPFPDPVLVGVAVTAHNNNDPIGGIATVSDLSVTVTPSAPILTPVTQVQDASTHVGSDAHFSFVVTNSAIANGSAANYQWYKNGQMVTNATGPNFSVFASAADNGAKVYSVASLPGASVNSATGTVSVATATEYPGYLKYQVYPGHQRADVNSGSYGPASRISAMPGFEAPVDWSADFGSRLSGYFIPPANGDYVFFICSDDDSDLWLGTNSSPDSVRLIAQQLGWANSRNWVNTGGTGATDLYQKRSDYFSPDGATTPYALGIPLVGGQKYFIMATHREGGGGDNLGVYAKLYADPDPVDGVPSNLTGAAISMLSGPATTLEITTQPVDTQVFEGLDVTLQVAATTDAEVNPVYQWQRNQVDMAGRTTSTLNLSPASLADNGAKYRCIVTLPPTSLSVTSAEVTLTVQASVFIPSLVKQEIWGPGAATTRAEVNAGTAGPATTTTYIGMFDQPDFADNYAQRLSTWFKPPQNGNYVFFLCSDDDSDLFLSTNDDPATKRLIAQQANWNGTRDWDGGENVAQRRSDQWSPNNDGSMPYAAGIPLLANQLYYIEAVHREGTGGDNLAAYYVINDGVNPVVPPADGTPSNLTGDRVGVKLPEPTSLVITDEPDDQSVNIWGTATFTVETSTDALYPPNYQWRRGGVNIPGATTAQYVLDTVPGDNGATFDVVVTLAASSLAVTSRVATLTIAVDTVAPVVVGAGAIAKSDGTTIELGVEFSEPMDHASATTLANYTLSKGTVTGVRHYPFVALPPNFDAVALEVTGLVNGDTVDLTVQNVKDVSLNAVATTVKPVTVNTAIRYAIVGAREIFNTPPAGTTAADWPDEAIALGNGNYLMLSSCNSHWAQYDEQTYVYEVLTGDFERVVRVQHQDDSSNWARAGLMAREELQEGMDRNDMLLQASRLANIRINPVRQWSGVNANNQIERNARKIIGGGYEDLTAGTGGNPAYPNQWLRITRVGDMLSTFHSANGVDWSVGGTWTPDVAEPLNAALHVGAFYAPELNNNNSAAGIGHSPKAIFRSYAAQVVLPPVLPSLSITKSGNNVEISWAPTGGTLQSRTSLTSGTWTTVGTANPAIVPISGAETYFRVVTP